MEAKSIKDKIKEYFCKSHSKVKGKADRKGAEKSTALGNQIHKRIRERKDFKKSEIGNVVFILGIGAQRIFIRKNYSIFKVYTLLR